MPCPPRPFVRPTNHRALPQDAVSAANQCRAKIALFSAQLERYKEAADIFEEVRVGWACTALAPPTRPHSALPRPQIGSACLGNNLLKFNAKGHFLNAGISLLAGGVRAPLARLPLAWRDAERPH